MIDLKLSRRGYYECCKWWSRNENENIENSELVMKVAPTGIFYAKEVSSESDEDTIVGGAFLVEKTTVTIKSPDNLTGINDKDIVLYDGNIWRVTSVQKKRIKKQSNQFLKNDYAPHIWILNLRR